MTRCGAAVPPAKPVREAGPDLAALSVAEMLAALRVDPQAGLSRSEVETRRARSAGALVSQEANQDPIDLAFLAEARARRVFDAHPSVTPASFAPFDAKTRRTEAIVEQDGHRQRVMKGAVRTLAEACAMPTAEIDGLKLRVGAAAAKGYRTLAVARGPESGLPTLTGLVTLFDPPPPMPASSSRNSVRSASR